MTILEKGIEKNRYLRFRQIRDEYKIKPLHDIHLRVVLYGRVSTDRIEQKTSIVNQETFYSDYIRNNPNWEFIGEYIDEGISGISATKRGDFQQMIRDAMDGKFDLIITKDVYRFARNTLDSIYYTRKLLENCVAVYFQTDNINTLDDDSELRLTIMSGIAQEEVTRLSKRIKFGHKQSIKNGTVHGNSLIYGYKKDHCKLVVVEKEAEMIRYIFQQYATGGTSTPRLEKELYSMGYRNSKGGKIDRNVIKHIIMNPKYKGYYCGGKVEIVDLFTKKQYFKPEDEWIQWKDYSGETVPAIIDEETWNKANEIYKQRSEEVKSRRHSYKTKNLFTGKLICSEHNTPFWMKQHRVRNEEEDPSWVCSYRIKNGAKSCDLLPIKESTILSILIDIVRNLSGDIENVVNKYLSYMQEIINKNPTEDIVKQLKEKISVIELKKEKILEYNLEGHISNAEFIKRNDMYNEEIKDLKSEIDKNLSTINKDNIFNNVDKLKETVKKYADIGIEDIKKPEIISEIIDKIYVKVLPAENDIDYCAELKFKLNSGKDILETIKKNDKMSCSGNTLLTIYPEQHILTNTIHQHYKIKVLYKYTVVI